MPIVSARSQPIPVGGGGAGARPRVQIRSRTMSLSSTGSSPPNSASPDGSPTQIRSFNRNDIKFEFALTSEQAASGKITGLGSKLVHLAFLSAERLFNHLCNLCENLFRNHGNHDYENIFISLYRHSLKWKCNFFKTFPVIASTMCRKTSRLVWLSIMQIYHCYR